MRAAAKERGVEIMGDVPIYVSLDSADVWAHPELFQIDEMGQPMAVSGVPPDYFSETGQLWGNPLYDWEQAATTGYEWWIERMRANLRLCDLLRIDHFRAFSAYWAVPAGETTALNGKWVPGPGAKLFEAARVALGGDPLPIVAEDLGDIDADVKALLAELGFPGMKVLQFAFYGADSEYLPHRHTENALVYTGTHDNDTAKGWYAALKPEERERVYDYLGSDGSEIALGAHPRGLRLRRPAGPRSSAGRARPRQRGPHEHARRARRQLDLAGAGLGVPARGRGRG